MNVLKESYEIPLKVSGFDQVQMYPSLESIKVESKTIKNYLIPSPKKLT